MLWFIVAIISYSLMGVVSLGDKHLLSGKPNPKIYSFYVGILGILVLLLIPFVNFNIPNKNQIILSFLSGSFSIIALYFFFKGLEKFEASRIVPSIGGITPVLVFLLFLGKENSIDYKNVISFSLLVIGSVIITYNKNSRLSLESFIISFLAALFFALHFFSSKYVYLTQDFWTGLINMRVGAFITSLFFLFSRDVRAEIFLGKRSFSKKTGIFFIFNQGAGAFASILQQFSIYLAGISYVSIVIALSGIQYVFVFIFSIFASLFFPFFIKEEINRRILLQKIVSIIMIFLGILILNINA